MAEMGEVYGKIQREQTQGGVTLKRYKL